MFLSFWLHSGHHVMRLLSELHGCLEQLLAPHYIGRYANELIVVLAREPISFPEPHWVYQRLCGTLVSCGRKILSNCLHRILFYSLSLMFSVKVFIADDTQTTAHILMKLHSQLLFLYKLMNLVIAPVELCS